MGDFFTNVSKWAERTKQDVDKSIRSIEMQLFTAIIMQSPVGNPELWKRYTRNVRQRQAYTTFAGAFNAEGKGRKLGVSNAALNRKFGRVMRGQLVAYCGVSNRVLGYSERSMPCDA